MTGTGDFEATIRADIQELPALTEAFRSWAERAGLPAEAIFAADLAIEELVANAIQHGLHSDSSASIRLAARHETSCLAVELRDLAPAFDPFLLPAPDLQADIPDRHVGGLGVHLVRTMMDDYRYSREGAENVVRIFKRLNVDDPGKEKR